MPISYTDSKPSLRGKFKNLPLRNRADIFLTAQKGVSTKSFYDFATVIEMADKDLAGMINLSSRTVSNYKETRKNFEPIHGEHLLKLIALYLAGEEIFGNVQEFHYWLNKPLWKSSERPIDKLVTSLGVDLIAEEIEKIAQGYPL